jgi:hypothetical protein
MQHLTTASTLKATRKGYERPELTAHGPVDKMTGWWSGPHGEMVAGQGQGYNPWNSTCHS